MPGLYAVLHMVEEQRNRLYFHSIITALGERRIFLNAIQEAEVDALTVKMLVLYAVRTFVLLECRVFVINVRS